MGYLRRNIRIAPAPRDEPEMVAVPPERPYSKGAIWALYGEAPNQVWGALCKVVPAQKSG